MDESFICNGIETETISLSPSEENTLKNQDTRLISTFFAAKLEKDCKKNWDLFYKRNEDRFFKDRHWTVREFQELLQNVDQSSVESESSNVRKTLLEVGCGVGNFIFPLLEVDKFPYFIYACDFSERAITIVKNNRKFDENRVKVFVADITKSDQLFSIVEPNSIDVITLIFVLSAVHPDQFDAVITILAALLKPEGVLLFRDYGLYDMTQLRFKPGHKISDNFYWRQDGTRTTTMFSAIKKLTSSGSKNGDVITPPGLQTMPRILQTKFSKGVQYNMKIIIKGDRNVGKTSLFDRLQGRSFSETYTPTDEIQVTSIQWNYKTTDDIVKVEVWDVVDKGKKRQISENLKLEASTSQSEVIEPALDAEFLNVYKGTNGVILVMDITKNWTFEYVQRELEKVPKSIPVLVLGNHCDMSHHRCVTPDHVIFYLETLHRSAPVRYAEGSMYNGFGLKFLHKWFNLPFLQLQRETLLAQLNTNENEIGITTQELDLYQQTDDSNYKTYLDRLTNHRRKVAESQAAVPTSSIVIQTQHDFPMASKGIEKNESKLTTDDGHNQKNDNNASSDERKLDVKTEKKSTATYSESRRASKVESSLRNIEEFVPDEFLDKSFLDELNISSSTQSQFVNKSSNLESDSETETDGNPLVSAFQDDLDPDDMISKERFSTIGNLESWMSSEGRKSPEGGEDDDLIIQRESTLKNDSAQKTKKSKSNQALDKDRARKKKHSKKKSVNNELENFLNLESDAYEAL